MMGLPSMISSLFRGSRKDEDGEAEDDEPVTVHSETSNPTKAWQMLSVKQQVKKVKLVRVGTPMKADSVRFVCVSDTHNRNPIRVAVPDGDVLLHTGDFSMVGRPEEIESFNNWLGTLPHKHKIVIAGNHDLTFDDEFMKNKSLGERFSLDVDKVKAYMAEKGITEMKEVLTNCTYLQDSETSVYGLRIYGSPWQPEFCDWAFNLPRGQPCLDKWDLIPAGIDVLMTHGPPIGHGDLCSDNVRAGCVELLHTIQKRVKCKYHVFGHIHEAYGVTTDTQTVYVNACTCTLNYRPCNEPIIFDIPLPPGVTKDDVTSGSETAGAVAGQKEEEDSEQMEVEEEKETVDNSSPLVLNQEYRLEPTPAPHSSTSTEQFRPT